MGFAGERGAKLSLRVRPSARTGAAQMLGAAREVPQKVTSASSSPRSFAPVKTSTIAPSTLPLLAGIRLGQSDRVDAETWYGTVLVWFMRLLALMWIAQGLADWGLILIGDGNQQGVFGGMSDVAMAAVIFFAVLDLIAGVGLWLAAAWGGVVWLIAVAAQWLALVVLPGFFAYDVAISAFDVALVAGYFILTFQAAREVEE